MNKKSRLSVVLGTYNRKSVLKLTVWSIRNELAGFSDGYELIVVDGGSTDGSLRWLIKQKDIITIVQHNRGTWKGRNIARRPWGYFMNLGFKCAQGKYICMLSDDCLVVPGAIRNGYRVFEDGTKAGEKIGAVAFYWRDWPIEKEYRVGTTLGGKMFVNHGLFLKEALEDVDYIDQDLFFFYHADGDLALKMWQSGWKVIDSQDSFIEHCVHVNTTIRNQNSEKVKEDWNNYIKKWKGTFYKEEGGNIGGWIKKPHADESRIANLFKRVWGIKIKLMILKAKAFSRGH